MRLLTERKREDPKVNCSSVKRDEFASVYRIQTWRGQWREPVKILPFTRKVEISSLLIQQVVFLEGKTNIDCIKILAAFNHLGSYDLPMTALCLLCSNTLTYAKQARHLSYISFPAQRKNNQRETNESFTNSGALCQCLAQGHFRTPTAHWVSFKWSIGLT